MTPRMHAIFQRWMPGGQHLEKWKTFTTAGSKHRPYNPNACGYDRVADIEISESVPGYPSAKVGNLPWPMYRYFRGMVFKTSGLANCRACTWSCAGYSDKKALEEKLNEHLSTGNCSIILGFIYKKLSKDCVCLICSKSCGNTGPWGVCVHPECMYKFQFELHITQTWWSARDEARRELAALGSKRIQ